MYERLEKCPSCNAKKFHNVSIIKDHSISGESFALVQCDSCHLLFTNPRPKQSEIWKYYQSENYISHSNKASSLKDILYKLVRTYTITQKIRLVKSLVNSPTLLDYGCGTGHFLKAAIKLNISSVGLEPTKNQIFERDNPLTAHICESINELKDTEFNVITAWHVLEHVHSLQQTLKELTKRLSKGGHMVLALPNQKSNDAELYKENWAGYDVPRHLYHFSKESLLHLTSQYKLKLIKTIPMYFDAFYVSILSEQYIGNRSSLLTGIKNGFNSNLKSRKNGQYSSIIYVLQK